MGDILPSAHEATYQFALHPYFLLEPIKLDSSPFYVKTITTDIHLDVKIKDIFFLFTNIYLRESVLNLEDEYKSKLQLKSETSA